MKIRNSSSLSPVNVPEMKAYNTGIPHRYSSCRFPISFMFPTGDYNFYLTAWGSGEHILKNSHQATCEKATFSTLCWRCTTDRASPLKWRGRPLLTSWRRNRYISRPTGPPIFLNLLF